MFFSGRGAQFFSIGVESNCLSIELVICTGPCPPSRSAHYHKFYSTMVIFLAVYFRLSLSYLYYYRYMFYSNLKVGCDGGLNFIGVLAYLSVLG